MSAILERSNADFPPRNPAKPQPGESHNAGPEPGKGDNGTIRDSKIWEKITNGAITSDMLAAGGLV